MGDKKDVRTIKPMSSINFGEILEKWNDNFNRSLSNRTDQWRLVAYPVMPGKDATQVALIFEQEININEPDCNSLYKYRVLLYDMTAMPMLLNSSEFQFKDWRIYTAWFFNKQIYVTMRDENNKFDVITIRGDGNEKILSLGRYVTDIRTTSRGDIFVGYDCCDDDETREPVMLFVRNGENKSLETDDAVSCVSVSVDSDDGLWAYVKPYNYICHMDGDNYETFPVSLTGIGDFGVSDDRNVLLGAVEYKYYGIRLYSFRKNEDDMFVDEAEIVLDTGEEEKGMKVMAAAFAGNKVVFRKGCQLHMFNINELTWKETEGEEIDQQNDMEN